MKFIDTHSHLYAKEFDEDRDEVVQKAIDSGVEKILLPNISSKYTQKECFHYVRITQIIVFQ